jgi:hypothetical protein
MCNMNALSSGLPCVVAAGGRAATTTPTPAGTKQRGHHRHRGGTHQDDRAAGATNANDAGGATVAATKAAAAQVQAGVTAAASNYKAAATGAASAAVATATGGTAALTAPSRAGVGATDVGPSGALQSVTPAGGTMHITTPGAVIENLNIHGSISIDAPNVTVRNVRVNSGDYVGVTVNSTGALLDHVEITGSEDGIRGDNYIGRNLDIHGVTGDGLKLGDNVTIENSYIHDFAPTATSHNDGVQAMGGSNSVLRNNRIEMGEGTNSAVFIQPELGGSINGLLVEGNTLSGGGWTMYVDGDRGPLSNVMVRNNTFAGPGGYGSVTTDTRGGSAATWSGNVSASGQTVQP